MSVFYFKSTEVLTHVKEAKTQLHAYNFNQTIIRQTNIKPWRSQYHNNSNRE